MPKMKGIVAMSDTTVKHQELKILKNEEKKMNLIMFLYLIIVPLVACGFVIFFNGGTAKDAIVLVMCGLGLVIKLLEKPLGKIAKYLYICVMPVWGAVVMVMGNPGVYGAMVEAYFLVLFLTIPYYSPSLVNVYAAATLIANVLAMIIFPDAFLVMHTVAVWIFLWLVFILAVAASHIIVKRTRSLFMDVENNEQRMEKVLSSVKTISQKLSDAGTALSDISTNEASSAEELSSTSEQLLSNSNILLEKARTSISNLNELRDSGTELSDNVRKVGETSDEVMRKSSENEEMLNSLQSVNKEVITSMEETNSVAGKLSEAVEGINDTLKLISDIAMQTNILSLNASIEAARAGEAGKGFSVVAHEVGNLAARTQNSLTEIRTVMDNVRENVEAMTGYVGDNNEKLQRQSEYFGNVFSNMEEMNDLLRQTAQDISAMNEVHGRQTEIIGHTVDISSDIAGSIEEENKGFSEISAMVENNARDAVSVSQQVEVIKEMAEHIDRLLTGSAG